MHGLIEVSSSISIDYESKCNIFDLDPRFEVLISLTRCKRITCNRDFE